ncbi:DUF2141 domain-containing protein [Paraferrimonas sedimenticola]|uniref:DUF2141 domain-containing protein n=1 Tax=Paraferrimonas sedimenticola TaxID=375674 RepID=A0AA37RWC1_9GAMM|nr:DUF2141 domain-containing protein [Paraferrimonas sedimenticola]GLP96421.1 hypothetical protein GCM10007895_17270 [Paraferrimonas sedimenticola]
MNALSRNLLAAVCALGFSSLAAAETLTLNLEGIDTSKGDLVIQIYNEADHWMEEETEKMALYQVFTAEQLGEAKSVQVELPHGEYAIYAYQDSDGDNELDTNWIGIPKEPVGVSNNAKGSMGPPKYKDAKFSFDENNSTQTFDVVSI